MQSSIVVSAERDERDDVDRADPRVLAGVHVHVDVVDGRRDEPLEGLGHRVVLAGDREDRPVVAGVAGPVEQATPGTRGMASARRSTTSMRRPSETFGTDSISTSMMLAVRDDRRRGAEALTNP